MPPFTNRNCIIVRCRIGGQIQHLGPLYLTNKQYVDEDQDALWVRTAGNTMIDNLHLNVGVDRVRLLGAAAAVAVWLDQTASLPRPRVK